MPAYGTTANGITSYTRADLNGEARRTARQWAKDHGHGRAFRISWTLRIEQSPGAYAVLAVTYQYASVQQVRDGSGPWMPHRVVFSETVRVAI